MGRQGIAVGVLLGACLMPAAGQGQTHGTGQVFTPLNPKRSSADVGINNTAAPVPEPLFHAKRVFISYELGDVTAFPSSYSGGPERAYNELYAQMRSWGRYQLVLDPKQADLIFAVRFVDPPAASPQVRLGILDPTGRVSLWGFVEQVDSAFLKKHRDANFSGVIGKLVSDVQALLASGGQPGPAEAAPQTAPQP